MGKGDDAAQDGDDTAAIPLITLEEHACSHYIKVRPRIAENSQDNKNHAVPPVSITIRTWNRVHVCVCVRAYVYVYIYICIHIHTYIYIFICTIQEKCAAQLDLLHAGPWFAAGHRA